ncbi:positive regulator of put (proline utilization) [Pleurostoma richardsiae]|uniref:Positive regulator of put (Proline utilization) n=1 Tax=Pleurostoma richardsiae TaxID=41990 RepID=A0AA38RDH3_9PEZI|nr:positive regulator of put (proline utilization) [Pleurostoma richardsiae]
MELSEESRYIRARVANACDGCKARKVKCDGKKPCGYCVRRQRPGTCHYSPPQQRRRPHQVRRDGSSATGSSTPMGHETLSAPIARGSRSPAVLSFRAGTHVRASQGGAPSGRRSSDAAASNEEHDETEVPREARLLRDAQGKLIFIGDCAPLSFFQTVRQLVCSRVDETAFAPQTSRYSVLENASDGYPSLGSYATGAPDIQVATIPQAVDAYLAVAEGLVDLFVDNTQLAEDILLWAKQAQEARAADDGASAVHYLVLAIGCQESDESAAQAYFNYAREKALSQLSGDLSVSTVHAFVLMTLYMLCSCQINGAFLFFGLAVRAAYSIGVHRTEVNSRFGPTTHRQRDRLWKSLRIVDLFLSTSMGRPPATSDVDCTVSYKDIGSDGHELFDILNASVQIFLIIEGIVVEIYSRRKISLQLTEGISRQLREFSLRWLQQLKDVVSAAHAGKVGPEASGACKVLASYYYAVMLVSRPFLMYELHRRLSSESAPPARRGSLVSGKSKLADACIDAASLMVDPILGLLEGRLISGPMPLLASWLFAASLALGGGLLGGFGRILEKHARMSISALEHLAVADAHAVQYSLIAKSLLETALEHLEKREARERQERTESSAQLFGLIPQDAHDADLISILTPGSNHKHASLESMVSGEKGKESQEHAFESDGFGFASPMFGESGPEFLMLSNSLRPPSDLSILGSGLGSEADSSLAALNLFPLLESGGHIDLAHYL